MNVPSGSSEAARHVQHRVLMVEDNPGDARLIEHLLGPQSAFSLDHVTTLASTRMRLVQERYDAVLLDLSLPDGEQADTLREIARFAAHIPIVALTGVEDEELAKLCLATGIQDYIFKSELNDATLVRSLNHAISRHRASELQRRIESAQRQISLGRVAGGVVHEVNNMATVVLSSLEDLRARLDVLRNASHVDPRPVLSELIELLEQDISAMSRMNALAGDLRIFAQREAKNTGALDLNDAVRSTLRLLDRRLRLRAELSFELSDVPSVHADESKLSQVLINLLLNAADAVDEGSTSERRIRVATRFDPPWVMLEVSDTGCGIPKADIDRVFEPFFSSKPLGRGSGLGLSICAELVASWDGRLEVESEEGQGSCFRVKLPISPRSTRRGGGISTAVLPRASRRVRRSARVLLIDDMDAPRRAIRRLMDREHVVEEAASGAEGLELLAAGPPFDVVLCDLMMPEMDGMGFYRRALEIDSGLIDRCIFLTGGAFTEDSQASLGDVDVPVLGKPLTRATLLGAIDEILARGSESSVVSPK